MQKAKKILNGQYIKSFWTNRQEKVLKQINSSRILANKHISIQLQHSGKVLSKKMSLITIINVYYDERHHYDVII